MNKQNYYMTGINFIYYSHFLYKDNDMELETKLSSNLLRERNVAYLVVLSSNFNCLYKP